MTLKQNEKENKKRCSNRRKNVRERGGGRGSLNDQTKNDMTREERNDQGEARVIWESTNRITCTQNKDQMG